MKINRSGIQVPVTGSKRNGFRLAQCPTTVPDLYQSKSDYQERMAALTETLSELQRVLYAHSRYALLLIFQGMDTAGKDGVIRHVMSGVNPQGCQVTSFKQPSQEELAHDYLWRTIKRLPMRGHIGIFNRSYYEEVLVARAVPEVLAAQSLPEECLVRPRFWKERYTDIVRFEDYLHRNGIRVLKFFLHLSKEEQRQRLLQRAEEPEKNWKISPADIKSRSRWDDYQALYDECLRSTSHAVAPWHVVPADDKRNARLMVSQALVAALQALPMAYPQPDSAQKAEVRRVRKTLKAEAPRHSAT